MIRGRFGAAPAPRRVPGRWAADSRPGGDSSSGASGRRPPGQRELGRERGAGDRGRAPARARRPEEGLGVTRNAVKGAMPSRSRGPPGGDGKTELRTRKGEQDASTLEGGQHPRSREMWGRTPQGTQAPDPRTPPPSEARKGGGTSLRAPPRRWFGAGPAPRRAPLTGSALISSHRLAPPPRPAYRSRIRRAAASGAGAKCTQRRHGHPGASSLPGPSRSTGPAGPWRPLGPKPPPQAWVPSQAQATPGDPAWPPQRVPQARAHHLGPHGLHSPPPAVSLGFAAPHAPVHLPGAP